MVDRRVTKVLAILETQWRRPVHLAELARTVNLGPSRMEHLFKGHVGVSIRDYVRNRRLDEAARMLANTELRISEIACLVGFPDPANFNHAFRKRFGANPRAFRVLEEPGEQVLPMMSK
jgi:AraC-type DNA-binding domain-containing proteins